MTPSGRVTRLSLLGPWQLVRDGCVVDLGSNAQRLLAILAIRGALGRAQVAGIIWPDCRESRALGNLRATLSRLRRQLGGLVRVSGGALTLNEAVEVDVRDLETAASAVFDGSIRSPYWTTLRVLASGDLLPGWYDDWVDDDRERLRQLRLHALEALTGHLIDVDNLPAAVEAGLAAVAIDPLRESAHRAVISAHLAEGNVAEAMRQFARVRRVLNQELGVEPTPLTSGLLQLAGTMGGGAEVWEARVQGSEVEVMLLTGPRSGPRG